MANYRYYIGNLVKQTLGEQSWWSAPAGTVGMVDLATLATCGTATDSASDRPLAFFAVDGTLDSSWTLLGQGDCREIATTSAMRDAFRSLLGYRPSGDKLVDLLWDFLTNGADAEGDATCPPLVPTREGYLELILGGHSPVRREKFAFGTHGHTNKLKQQLKKELKWIRKRAIAGDCRTKDGVDYEFHRRYLGGVLMKYGLTADDAQLILPPGWDKSETPKRPGTQLAENFNTADSTTLGPTYSWSEYVDASAWDTFSIVSNRCRSTTGTSYGNTARCNTDLGGSDITATIVVSTFTDGATNNQFGACTRFKSNAATAYFARGVPYYSPDAFDFGKIVNGVSSVINQDTNCPLSTSKIISVGMSGSSYTATFDGGHTRSGTDTAISSNTRGGLFGYATSASYLPEMDDWTADDGLTSGQPAIKRLGGIAFATHNRGVW